MTAEEMFRTAETGEEFAAACLAEARQIERDRHEAALRKIAAWKKYEDEVDEYEAGANDMLETLQQIAEEALS